MERQRVSGHEIAQSSHLMHYKVLALRSRPRPKMKRGLGKNR